MNYRGLAVSGVKFLSGMSAPISIGCVLTHRCNLHCEYCNFPGNPTDELSTDEWKQAITEFARAGTIRFGFTGGEPLLRQDAPELLRHAKRTGAVTSLCSNGILVPDRIDDLDGLDVYITSLDGACGEVHDYQRKSAGSFEKSLAGIDAVLATGKEVKTLTVITPHNIGEVPGILDLADKMGFKAGFQPATTAPLASALAESLAPDPLQFSEMLSFLLDAKKQGRNVLSSGAALTQMKNYPRLEGTGQCRSAGRYFGYVSPDGHVFPCHLEYSTAPEAHPSGRERGYVTAFNECRDSSPACKGCYIVPLTEMNMVFSLKPSAVWEQVRTAVSR